MTTIETTISDEYAAIMEIDKNTAYIIQQVAKLSDQQEMTGKLLTVLIKGGKVEEISGYVYGQTSTGDPFLILYPAKEVLLHKICRVYQERFHLLPSFIPIIAPPPNAPEDNPKKDAARRAGIYVECDPFTIATEPGKDTNMGAEVRFLMTVDASGIDNVYVQNIIKVQAELAVAHNPGSTNKHAPEELGVLPLDDGPATTANEPLSQEDTDMDVGKLNEMLGLGEEEFSPETPDAPKEPKNLTKPELPFEPDEPKPEEDTLKKPYRYGDGTYLSTKSPTLRITYEAYFDVHRAIPNTGLMLKEWYDKSRDFLNTSYDLPLPA